MTDLPLPGLPEEIHSTKYRAKGETFREWAARVANALKDDDHHYKEFRDALLSQRFLPAGRVQAAMGSPRHITPYNCFVSGFIPDSMRGIMARLDEASQTMRLGGGIGYDFSTLRPSGDRITTLDAPSSGPVSFMGIYDAMCQTVMSAGMRRGAMMGVLRVDHPDIETFVHAKQNTTALTGFNISVAVTDRFMEAVAAGEDFPLQFGGRVYKWVDARLLWEEIMRSTWDWAEPGVLFIDRINQMNNLWYCETIAATNPCAEQPLPPYGACLLGSFDLTKYLMYREGTDIEWFFNWEQFKHDIPIVVRAMDNVVDRAVYPLDAQRAEAESKRRMGLGITGLANAGEALGLPYASQSFLSFMRTLLSQLRDAAYKTSVALAIEKGAFPAFDPLLLESGFAKTLPAEIREDIAKHGLRNSHLLSIAPTGTISLAAGNVSSSIEPVFSHSFTRDILLDGGKRTETVHDYGVGVLGVRGRQATDISAEEHLDVLACAYEYVDSAVSKTCNVNPNMPWEEFKDIYFQAWKRGCKGCTTFNPGGKRMGILNAPSAEPAGEQGAACYIDPATGIKTCDE
jgi:ribonucleoside-diphosphate reductase alpha chain